LLEAARAGDDEALEALVARHEGQVFRFALRLCGSEQDACDVTQETLLALLTSVSEFREESELSTWLFQVARNSSARLCRKRAGEPAELEPLEDAARALPCEDVGPCDGVESKQLIRAVREVILSLPRAQREAIVLRDYEGLSAEEAAQLSGLDVHAHKSRLHRGRLNLHQRVMVLLGEDALPASCRELVHELLDKDEHDIDQATCIRLEHHLKTCPACGPASDDLRRAVSICRRLPGTSVPSPVQAAVRVGLRVALCSGGPRIADYPDRES